MNNTTSQQRNLDIIRFTTVCCWVFRSRRFVCSENFEVLKLIPSHSLYCYQIEKQVLAPHEAVPRAWCTEIWRTPHVTHPPLPHYLIRKSVGMWQPSGGASAPYAGFGWSFKWDVCKKRTLSVQVWVKQGARYEVSLSHNLWGAVHWGMPSSTIYVSSPAPVE